MTTQGHIAAMSEQITREREVDARWTVYHHDTARIVREIQAQDDLEDFLKCENALTASVRVALWLLAVPVAAIVLLAALHYLGW